MVRVLSGVPPFPGSKVRVFLQRTRDGDERPWASAGSQAYLGSRQVCGTFEQALVPGDRTSGRHNAPREEHAYEWAHEQGHGRENAQVLCRRCSGGTHRSQGQSMQFRRIGSQTALGHT